jgi:hypothetical protein
MAELHDEGPFYVELRSEDNARVEISARRQECDLAIAWLEERLAADPKKVGRMHIQGPHQLTDGQHTRIVRFGIQLI